MEPFPLGERTVRVEDVVAVARHGRPVRLAEAARERMMRSRAVILELVGEQHPEYGIGGTQRMPMARMQVERYDAQTRVAYGVTTGFGELARVAIPHQQLMTLQRNLLLSHACGMGEPLPEDAVRALLFLRAASLARGLSGVRPELVEAILGLLEKGVTPVVPSRGSLGASGDLVPLAHACLVLLGEGEATYRGQRMTGAQALREAGLAPVELQPKEGLALINGTQMMSALLALAVHDGWNLVRTAEVAAAMSIEALFGSVKPFDERVHAARPHAGQSASAANLRRLLEGSAIVESHVGCHRVQDAYSLRCAPQILGPVRDALAHVERTLEVEFGSATDNPLIFEDGPVSGGNFHGENLGLLCALLAPALAEVAALAERRVARLVDPRLSEGLPAFLVPEAGVHSGLMIPQYVAAALVLENQILVHPAVAGSLPTSANQEDHVSNGAVGALLLTQALRNAERVVGIEALSAAQALDLRAPLKPSPATGAARDALREAGIAFLDQDRLLAPDLERAAHLVRSGALLAAAQRAAPGLA